MAEYIDREDLAKHLDILYNRLCGKSPHFYCGFMTAVDYVKEFSDADVAPVAHGRWREAGPLLECPFCGEIYSSAGGGGYEDGTGGDHGQQPVQHLPLHCPAAGRKESDRQDELQV